MFKKNIKRLLFLTIFNNLKRIYIYKVVCIYIYIYSKIKYCINGEKILSDQVGSMKRPPKSRTKLPRIKSIKSFNFLHID